MTTVFIGEVDHTPFVAAHTLVSGEQEKAVHLIEALADPESVVPVEFSQAGWVIRKAAPDLSPQVVDESIGDAEVCVEYVKEVPKNKVISFVGRKALAFLRPIPTAEKPDSILSIAR